jgi:hypothetical protein
LPSGIYERTKPHIQSKPSRPRNLEFQNSVLYLRSLRLTWRKIGEILGRSHTLVRRVFVRYQREHGKGESVYKVGGIITPIDIILYAEKQGPSKAEVYASQGKIFKPVKRNYS